MDNLALNILKHTAKPMPVDDLWFVIDWLYRPTKDYYTRTVEAMTTIGLLHLEEGKLQRSSVVADLQHVYGDGSIEIPAANIATVRAEIARQEALKNAG